MFFGFAKLFSNVLQINLSVKFLKLSNIEVKYLLPMGNNVKMQQEALVCLFIADWNDIYFLKREFHERLNMKIFVAVSVKLVKIIHFKWSLDQRHSQNIKLIAIKVNQLKNCKNAKNVLLKNSMNSFLNHI